MVVLPDTLTLAQAKSALPLVEQALGSQARETGVLVVDASALCNFDSAAIAVLLEARRRAQAAGRAFKVRGAPAAMVELSTLYGVDGLLGFETGAA